MKNTEEFKQLLEEEKSKLEKELGTVGRINPDNQGDWEGTPKDMNTMRADMNEAADAIEEFEARSAVEVELENRLQNVKEALQRIEKGTYGTCEIGDEEIEEARLQANPAATTCMKHINDKIS